jgi:hypothetical protein
MIDKIPPPLCTTTTAVVPKPHPPRDKEWKKHSPRTEITSTHKPNSPLGWVATAPSVSGKDGVVCDGRGRG